MRKLLVLIFALCVSGCSSDVLFSEYRSVRANPGGAVRINHDRNELHWVHNGELFLKVGDISRTCVADTIVNRLVIWNSDMIEHFRANHPELEEYWPLPAQRDGGVLWLDDVLNPDRKIESNHQ